MATYDYHYRLFANSLFLLENSLLKVEIARETSNQTLEFGSCYRLSFTLMSFSSNYCFVNNINNCI